MKIDDLPKMAKTKLESKQYFLSNQFMYGDNWYRTAAWYLETYPGFTNDECEALELFSKGIRAKQYKSMLKKQKRNAIPDNSKAPLTFQTTGV